MLDTNHDNWVLYALAQPSQIVTKLKRESSPWPFLDSFRRSTI
jgi:hypothetical protein